MNSLLCADKSRYCLKDSYLRCPHRLAVGAGENLLLCGIVSLAAVETGLFIADTTTVEAKFP